jgi:peptide-methionine (S)-S-oxide reductase
MIRVRSQYGVMLSVLAACLLPFASPLGAQARVQAATKTTTRSADPTQTAVFAGGCFWGIEAVFEHTKGVISAVSGYSGGGTENPTYEEVSTETTGHAESVRVTFDPVQVSYDQLLEVFFAVHNPTELNRQGPDIGSSYRSAVFYQTDDQKRAAEAYLGKLTAAKKYPRKIVTAIEPLKNFYEAEGYHQHYLTYHPNQPYIVYNDLPKLEYLKRNFPALYREDPVN